MFHLSARIVGIPWTSPGFALNMCGVQTVWTERRSRNTLTGHAAQAEAWEGAAASHVTYLRQV